jgi:hypothetical protein
MQAKQTARSPVDTLLPLEKQTTEENTREAEMRKYTGEAPNAIKSIERIHARDRYRYLVKTNNGAQYFLDRCAPAIGDDILWFKFERAQPYTFQQDGNAFHRMIDGWAMDFAVYPVNFSAENHFPHGSRKQFIEDMARQNIVCKFTA